MEILILRCNASNCTSNCQNSFEQQHFKSIELDILAAYFKISCSPVTVKTLFTAHDKNILFFRAGVVPRVGLFMFSKFTFPLGKNIYTIYRVFFFRWIQSRGCKTATLRSFQQYFLLYLHSKIWAHFHFGTF